MQNPHLHWKGKDGKDAEECCEVIRGTWSWETLVVTRQEGGSRWARLEGPPLVCPTSSIWAVRAVSQGFWLSAHRLPDNILQTRFCSSSTTLPFPETGRVLPPFGQHSDPHLTSPTSPCFPPSFGGVPRGSSGSSIPASCTSDFRTFNQDKLSSRLSFLPSLPSPLRQHGLGLQRPTAPSSCGHAPLPGPQCLISRLHRHHAHLGRLVSRCLASRSTQSSLPLPHLPNWRLSCARLSSLSTLRARCVPRLYLSSGRARAEFEWPLTLAPLPSLSARFSKGDTSSISLLTPFASSRER